eukprot:6190836-Pleurochrysis_carterae.AAC.4
MSSPRSANCKSSSQVELSSPYLTFIDQHPYDIMLMYLYVVGRFRSQALMKSKNVRQQPLENQLGAYLVNKLACKYYITTYNYKDKECLR